MKTIRKTEAKVAYLFRLLRTRPWKIGFAICNLVTVILSSDATCRSQEAHFSNEARAEASAIGELLICSCENRLRNSSKGSFNRLFDTELKVDPRLGNQILVKLEKIKKEQEKSGFSSSATVTLFGYDRVWKSDFEPLSDGNSGANFEQISNGWISCGSAVKNIAGGAKIMDAGKVIKMVPGDVVLLRRPKKSIVSTMVYAGEGSFQKYDRYKHSFFFYPYLSEDDADLPRLRLNTWPPRLSEGMVKALVAKGRLEKSILQLPAASYRNKWLVANLASVNSKGVYGSCFMNVAGWKEQLNAFEFQVLRPKGHFLEFSVTQEQILRRDIKRAIKYSILAEKLLLGTTQDNDTDAVFQMCFGTPRTDTNHAVRSKYAAHVLRAFREHFYKAIVMNDTAYMDLDPVPGEVIAYVTPAFRPMVNIPENYFSKANGMRSTTLIHEFCHSYGFSGHPGTFDYGLKSAQVRQFLAAHGQNPPINFNTAMEHRLVQFDSSTSQTGSGFLAPENALVNPYAYDRFVFWLAQRKGW